MGKILRLKNNKKISTKKLMIFVIFLLLALSFVFVYLNRYNPIINKIFGSVLKTNVTNKNLNISFDTNVPYQFEIYKNNLLILGNDSLKSINKSANAVWEVPLHLNSPAMQVLDKYILAYDRKGKECFVVSDSTTVHHITTEQPIICAKINKSGFFVIATNEIGSLSQATVYNNKGEKVFKWHSGNNYILDVDISPDNKKVAICTMNTENGKLSSGVVFFKLNEDKPFVGKSKEDTIFTNIRFNKDGSLIAISNNMAILYNSRGNEKWSYNYDGGILSTFNFDSDDFLCFAVKKNRLINSETIIKTLSYDGKPISTYQTNGEIKNLSIKDNIISVSKDRELIVLTKGGNKIAETPVNRDIKKIFTMENKKEIMVIGSNIADIYELK